MCVSRSSCVDNSLLILEVVTVVQRAPGCPGMLSHICSSPSENIGRPLFMLASDSMPPMRPTALVLSAYVTPWRMTRTTQFRRAKKKYKVVSRVKVILAYCKRVEILIVFIGRR